MDDESSLSNFGMDDESSLSNFGNMIVMRCEDGIVVANLKQFLVMDGQELGVQAKHDSEYDKIVEIGKDPKVVLCGIGGEMVLSPLMNKAAQEVLEADENCFRTRPSIEMLSNHVFEHADQFLAHNRSFHLFIMGTNKDYLGRCNLDLRYINRSGVLEVPKKYIVGGQHDLIRNQIDRFYPETTKHAIDVIKFGFASVGLKESDLQFGYIDVRVIKNNGEVVKHVYQDFWEIVLAYHGNYIDVQVGGGDDESGDRKKR